MPVFLRDEKTGKLAPYRVIYPSYWARLGADGRLSPIAPEQVLAAGTESILGPKGDAKKFEPLRSLSEDQIAQVLEKLASARPQAVKPPDAIAALAATTAPATGPAPAGATAPATAVASTQPPPAQAAPQAGEVVYVTGGRMYKRRGAAAGDAKLDVGDLPDEQARYAWPLAHDVRPAQQSLGSRGCVECHSNGAPIFDGTTDSAAVLTGASIARPMHALRGDSMGALRTFAVTYPMRPILILSGYLSAGVLLLVLIAYGSRGVAAIARRRATPVKD